MILPAIRSIYKINRNVFQNFRRYSFKFEMTPANRPVETHEETLLHEQNEESAQAKKAPFRYNVCQPRKSQIERPSTVGDIVATQKESVKAAIDEQHLQPSMLPEYYQNQMERSILIHPEPTPNEEDRINNGPAMNTRRFQVSKTYANAILPLKSVKLANPFPEPVKTMMSRTVSDDEKAEQMLAESKSQRTVSDWGRLPSVNNNPQSRNFSTKRWFSSRSKGEEGQENRKECKKFGAKKQTKIACPKMTLKHCPKPARDKCDRVAMNVNCKKQEAPYPAYSEFCHEDVINKPSECKLCPWKPDENPNFKPQKKEMHTSAYNPMKRSGLEITGWNHRAETEDIIIPEEEGMMQCDLRKPQCERPNNSRCPPKDKKTKKEEDKKKKPTPSKTKSANLESARSITHLIENEPELVENLDPNEMSLKVQDKSKGGEQGPPCKIRKFKFPECKPIKKKQDEVKGGKCPTKKKKPLIRDCPPDDDTGGCQKSADSYNTVIEELSLSENPPDKTKCPKVDLTVNRPKRDEDPCKVKKTGGSKVCPGDLLKKKRRKPKKKASSDMITPKEHKKDPLQKPSIRTI